MTCSTEQSFEEHDKKFLCGNILKYGIPQVPVRVCLARWDSCECIFASIIHQFSYSFRRKMEEQTRNKCERDFSETFPSKQHKEACGAIYLFCLWKAWENIASQYRNETKYILLSDEILCSLQLHWDYSWCGNLQNQASHEYSHMSSLDQKERFHMQSNYEWF